MAKILRDDILPKIKAKVDSKASQDDFDAAIGDISAVLESI